MATCEYCNKTYCNKGNVVKHQKSSKHCILIQKNLFNCIYCKFKTSSKNDFVVHLNNCNDNTIINENKTLKKTNLLLQVDHNKVVEQNNKLLQVEYNKIIDLNIRLQKKSSKLKKVKSELEVKTNRILFIENEYTELKQQFKENVQTLILKPSITQSNMTTNKIDLKVNFNSDFIEKAVEDNFTLNHVEEGIKGFAKFTNDYIINKENGQSKYICSDTSRTIFKYKDENGMIQKDIKAIKLKNSMKDPIIKKSKLLFNNESSRLLTEMTKETNKEFITIKSNTINNLTKQFLKIKHINDHEDEYAKELVLYLN